MAENQKDHFDGKTAIQHIAQVQSMGKIASLEIHGAETPGSIFVLNDAAKETAFLFLLFVSPFFSRATGSDVTAFFAAALGWVLWKAFRAGWLTWSRLERLHRVMEEERYEIEHNRDQEREELAALYMAKGFQGKLLDDVVSVLMADSDRLLRVMLQEELGFRLDENEHPLQQAFFAGLGAFISIVFCLSCFLLGGTYFLIGGGFFIIGLTSYIYAFFEKNKTIPAIVWNLAFSFLGMSIAQYMTQFLVGT